MGKKRPILKIFADHSGVYEVVVAAVPARYERAERLSAAIRPAIDMINSALREAQQEEGET